MTVTPDLGAGQRRRSAELVSAPLQHLTPWQGAETADRRHCSGSLATRAEKRSQTWSVASECLWPSPPALLSSSSPLTTGLRFSFGGGGVMHSAHVEW
jgi:hypothetical protein